MTDVDGHDYADFCLGDTGAMAGHSPQPGLYMLFTLDPLQAPVQFKENILRHLFRRPALPQNPQRNRIHPRLMTLRKGSKTLLR